MLNQEATNIPSEVGYGAPLKKRVSDNFVLLDLGSISAT